MEAKSQKVSDLLDQIGQIAFGRGRSHALTNQICVCCGQPATTFKDKLSEREYQISGMCQACQDITFIEE